MNKLIYMGMFLVFISYVCAGNISVETQLTETDGTKKTGTFEMNFTIRNTTDDHVYTSNANRTTNLNGWFQTYFDLPYFGNSTLYAKWNSSFEDTGWKQIAYVPYAINALYLQGYDLPDFTLDTEFDNASVIRHYNKTWIINNQAGNCSDSNSCANILYTNNESDLTITESQISDLTHIGNCSDSNSCGNVIYTNNASWIINNQAGNCSDSNSCANILYTNNESDLTITESQISDLTHIGNCSDSNSCGNVIYTNNATWIINNQAGNCSNDNACSNIVYTNNASYVLYNVSGHGDINTSGNISAEYFCQYGEKLSKCRNLTHLSLYYGNCSISNSCGNIIYEAELNTELELESQLTDVSDVYTNNDPEVVLTSNASYILITNYSNIMDTNTSWIIGNQAGNCSDDNSCNNIVYISNASYVLTSNASYVKTDNSTYVLTSNASYVKTDNSTHVLTSNTTYVKYNVSGAAGNYIYLRDPQINISSSADGQLDIKSDSKIILEVPSTKIEINATGFFAIKS